MSGPRDTPWAAMADSATGISFSTMNGENAARHRIDVPVTRVPSRAVFVRPARKASVVQLSSMSSQCGPTWGICR